MSYLLVLLAVSLAVSGLGWIYFVFFFSIGYGFGISALAVTLAVLFRDVLTVPTALLCVVMFIFGCRLGLYLLTRENRSPEYKKILYGPDAAKKKLRRKSTNTDSLTQEFTVWYVVRTIWESLSSGPAHSSYVSEHAALYGSGLSQP